MRFLNLFAAWQETFAVAGDRDGWGDHWGSFWIHVKILSIPFWTHFRPILGPPMSTNYVFQ